MNNIYFHKQSLTQINLNSQTNQLSNYLIKQKIGEGSFSKVKLAINKITNEKVAIKIISKNKLMKTDKIRIEREIKILKSISHQNIIKFKSAFEDSHFYFLVMEYCDYKELFHYIIKYKKIEKEKASIIFYQLINALNYLHNNKICHRDLKPENILINEQNLKMKIILF
jgi:5'-AMP-activated protein kinase catalytic alpha subunit